MVKLYYAFPVDWLAFMNHYLVASVSFGLIQLSSLIFSIIQQVISQWPYAVSSFPCLLN